MGKIEKNLLIERRLAPLDLTDTEILDWLNEWCVQIEWNRATPEHCETFTVHCDFGIRASARTLRGAASFAAAIQQEANS